jgi:putative inorganic carbon (hco3(-)) transporter
MRVSPDTRTAAAAAVAAVLGAVAYTLGAYLLGPVAMLALAAGVAFGLVTFLRPAWGMAGAFLAAPLELFDLRLASGAVSPAEAGLALVAVAYMSRALLRPESVRMPAVRDLPIIVLLVAVGAGIVIADDPNIPVRVFILWTLFYFAYLQAQSFDVGEIRLVVIALVIGAGILGAVGTFNYLQAGGSQGLYGGGEFTTARAVGTFADPNYFAALLLLAVVAGAALVIGDFRRTGWLVVALGAAMAGLAFSLSRGGISGAALGLLVLLVWGRARWIAAVIVIVFVALTAFDANPILKSDQFGAVGERLSSISRPGVTEVSKRPEIWSAAIDVTIEHPFFGVGVNQFEVQAARRGLVEYGAPVENAHSVPLSLAAETGLIGLAAFLAFVGQLAVRSAAALRTRQRLAFALGLGLFAALLGFLVQAFTVTQFRTNVLTGTFLVVAGLLTALADRARRELPA